MISWLRAECMPGRISTSGRDWLLLLCAPAEGGQMPAGHTAPILAHAACAWRELRKSVAVPAQPKPELCCILLKQHTALHYSVLPLQQSNILSGIPDTF